MAHIVVLGAGLGGIPMTFELRETLGADQEITLVSDSEWFQFVPSNPWVAVGWRRPEDIKVHLPPLMARRNVRFTAVGAEKVVPQENTLVLRDGTRLPYDYLVIASGPAVAFDEIEGFGPAAHTRSICHVGDAAETAGAWEKFCRDPGPIVVGAVQGASCFGPAYEFALIMETELRRRKIRDRVPMTFITAEPYIGHLGLGGVGDTKGLLESYLRDRHIKWITNAKVERFAADKVFVTELDEDGATKQTHEVPFRLATMIPAFRGIDALNGAKGGIPGLTNPRGFVIVDKHQRNPAFSNVFAVGVCIAIPPVEKTPVPVGVPKTGYMIESMVAAAAKNLRELVAGREPSFEPTWNAVCLADFGDGGVAFVALPQIPPRNVNWSNEGYWVHLAKLGFEKYFLRRVRHGGTDPFYEKFLLKALGIEKLRGHAPVAAPKERAPA
jgi:sulfide:quinone oxidoreductase